MSFFFFLSLLSSLLHSSPSSPSLLDNLYIADSGRSPRDLSTLYLGAARRRRLTVALSVTALTCGTKCSNIWYLASEDLRLDWHGSSTGDRTCNQTFGEPSSAHATVLHPVAHPLRYSPCRDPSIADRHVMSSFLLLWWLWLWLWLWLWCVCILECVFVRCRLLSVVFVLFCCCCCFVLFCCCVLSVVCLLFVCRCLSLSVVVVVGALRRVAQNPQIIARLQQGRRPLSTRGPAIFRGKFQVLGRTRAG